MIAIMCKVHCLAVLCIFGDIKLHINWIKHVIDAVVLHTARSIKTLLSNARKLPSFLHPNLLCVICLRCQRSAFPRRRSASPIVQVLPWQQEGQAAWPPATGPCHQSRPFTFE